MKVVVRRKVRLVEKRNENGRQNPLGSCFT